MIFIGLLVIMFMLAIPVGFIWLIINLVRKKGKKKPIFLMIGSVIMVFALTHIFVNLFPEEMEQARKANEEREAQELILEQEEKETKEKEEAEEAAKKQAEKEAKEKEREEKEAKKKAEKEAKEREKLEEKSKKQEVAKTEEIESKEDEVETESESEEMKAEIFDNKKYLQENTDLNENQIDNAIKVLQEIGYNDFEFEDIQEGGGIESRKNYTIWYNTGKNVPYRFKLSFSDDKVWLVSHISNIYMYTKNNGFIYTLNDFDITYDEQNDAINKTQEYIKNILNDSKSAKFPSVSLSTDWGLTRCGNYVFVNSYVEGKNVYGGNARNDFYVQMTYPDMKIFYCEIGNETIGKGIDINENVDIMP